MTSLDAGRPGRARRAPKWILIGAVAALVATAATVALFVLLGGGGERTVQLEVRAEGTEVARINYGTGQKMSVLRPKTDGTELPWSTELEVPEGRGAVALSVANGGPTGTVSCKLFRGAKVVSEATAPSIAQCTVRTEDLFGE